MYGFETIACNQVMQNHPNNFWIYGNGDAIRGKLVDHPGCFGEAELWIFQDGEWIPFEF